MVYNIKYAKIAGEILKYEKAKMSAFLLQLFWNFIELKSTSVKHK